VLRSAGFPVDLLEGLRGNPPRGELLRLAKLPLFREAVAWQNPGFARNGLAWLERHPERTNWRARAHERTTLQYLQRYVMRNETVGFFGPSAWGELVEDGPAIACQPGEALVDRREVEWETWARAAAARCAPEERNRLEEARRRLASAAGDAARVLEAMSDL